MFKPRNLATELKPPDGRWEGTRSATSGYPWQRRVHERKSTRDTARMQTALAVVQEFVHCLGVVPRGMCNQGSRTGYGKRERLRSSIDWSGGASKRSGMLQRSLDMQWISLQPTAVVLANDAETLYV